MLNSETIQLVNRMMELEDDYQDILSYEYDDVYSRSELHGFIDEIFDELKVLRTKLFSLDDETVSQAQDYAFKQRNK